MAACLVDDLDGGPIGGGVAVTPLAHGGDDRPQVAALVGEAVVVAGRVFGVGDPHEHAGIDEAGEALLEDVAGDAEASLKLIEA